MENGTCAPFPRGFDEYKYLASGTAPNDGEQGLYFNPTFREKGRDIVRHEGYVTDIITDMTVEWLKNRDHSKPFFLMCHHKAPHDFWEYAPRFKHMFDNVEIPVPPSLFEDRSHRSPASRDYGSSVGPRSASRSLYVDFSRPEHPTGMMKTEGLKTFEDKTLAAYRKYLMDYLRTVAAIDQSVGKLLETLEQEGILDDTLVMYTSDQGIFLGEHDYQDKRWSYEESLRAPMLIRYPREIPAGSVSYELMSNIDLAPTLLEFGGIPAPYCMQGVSRKKMLEGKAAGAESIYFRYWMHRAHRHDNPAHYGIRTKDWKLIFYYGLPLDAAGAIPEPTVAGWELYDMQHDPLELHNVYNAPENKQVIAQLKAQLTSLKAKYDDPDSRYPQVQALVDESE